MKKSSFFLAAALIIALSPACQEKNGLPPDPDPDPDPNPPPCMADAEPAIALITDYVIELTHPNANQAEIDVIMSTLELSLPAAFRKYVPANDSSKYGAMYYPSTEGAEVGNLRLIIGAAYSVDYTASEEGRADTVVVVSLEYRNDGTWYPLATFEEEAPGGLEDAAGLQEFDENIGVPFDDFLKEVVSTLSEELKPSGVTFIVYPDVVAEADWTSSNSAELDVNKLENKFGTIESDDANVSPYCFEIKREVLNYNAAELDEEFIMTIDELWHEYADPSNSTSEFEYDLMPYFYLCDIGQPLYPCGRPIIKHTVTATYAYGDHVSVELEPSTPDGNTVVKCPRKLNYAFDSPLSFEEGESKDLTFQIVNDTNEGIPGITIDTILLTNETFGVVDPHSTPAAPAGVVTDDEGFFEVNVVAAAELDNGISTILAVSACQEAEAAQLGEDRFGNPVPWGSDLYCMPVLAHSDLPIISVSTVTEHQNYSLTLHENLLDSDSASHILEQFTANERISLSFEVVFENRVVEAVDDPNYNFKGTVVRYDGPAIGQITVSETTPNIRTIDYDGSWTSNTCGTVEFDYQSLREEFTISLTNSAPVLMVFYQHFIPAADSIAQEHPLEGLSFTQSNIFDTCVGWQKDWVSETRGTDECSNTYDTSSMTTPMLTVPINHTFPMSLLTYVERCHGFEAWFSYMNDNQQSKTLRKLEPGGLTFDAVHLAYDVSLDENDTAECWEYVSSPPDEVYDGTVSGSFTWDYTAEITSGEFDLQP